MAMKVYRITVHTWPTEDGAPWPRFIAGPGTRITHYDDPVRFADEFPWFEQLPDDVKAQFSAGDAEHTWDYGSHNAGVIGWVLPTTSRRHYLSASTARTWVRKARLLGAEVSLDVGEVYFPDEASTEWAVDYGAGIMGCDDETEAWEMAQYLRAPRIVKRTVIKSQWVRA